MDIVSLLDIKNRDLNQLLEKVKSVRITHFSTPSSFHVQIVDEDESYLPLEIEMNRFYSGDQSTHLYCAKTQTLEPQKFVNPFLRKLEIKDLQSKIHIAVNFEGKWVRCVTKNNTKYCKNIDTGEVENLQHRKKNTDIYELEHRFLILPPRALLCGLSGVIPISENGHRWTNRACLIFLQLIKHRTVLAYFTQKGLLPNSFYLFLSTTNKDGTKIHINTALCAFDTAVVDVVGFHHPIWPEDEPC